MVVIGLTGGIGTGKSEVSRLLEGLGAVIIDADKVGHEAYLPHSEAWQEIVKTFGAEVLQPNEEIDRKKLGGLVFNDPKAMEKLNAIMHPKMYKMIEERIQRLKRESAKDIVVEAAILIEAHWTPLVDEVWVTVSPEEEVIRRIQSRNNLSADAIRSRIRSQMPQEERVRYAGAVIENDGDLSGLRERVETLWKSRMKKRRE